jgi:hypothetical protein
MEGSTENVLAPYVRANNPFAIDLLLSQALLLGDLV